MTDYNLIKRKGRNIQVIFKILPGKEISTGTTNDQEAHQFANNFLNNFDQRITSGNIPTFKDFAKGFYINDRYGYRKQLEKKKKYFKKEYWKIQQARLDNYWINRFGAILITAISPGMIDDWYVDICSQKSGKPLSDNTKNKILSCGDNVFNMAVRKKIIKENPIMSIEKITEENKHRQYFNDIEMGKLFPEDEKALFKIWLLRKWIVYFLIMRDTGWRPGEIAGLARRNYYVKIGGLYTEQSIDYINGSVQNRIKTTRKGQNYKIGYLSDLAIYHLDKYLGEEQIKINDLIFYVK